MLIAAVMEINLSKLQILARIHINIEIMFLPYTDEVNNDKNKNGAKNWISRFHHIFTFWDFLFLNLKYVCLCAKYIFGIF